MNASAAAWLLVLLLVSGLFVTSGPPFAKFLSAHLYWALGAIALTAMSLTFMFRRVLELALRVPGVAMVIGTEVQK